MHKLTLRDDSTFHCENVCSVGAQYYNLPRANINQIEFFGHFRDPLIKLNQKMLREQGKIEMLQNVAP